MVLVIVLWIITLLAVMAGGFAYSMRVETQLATSAVERAQGRALAEAGIAYALAWQLDAEAQKQWPPNGDARDWAFGGGRLRIAVINASGLVNLNNAGPDLLKALLAGADLNGGDQERVAEAIQDWRDLDDDRMPNGAESAEYRAANRPGPKNTYFESVEELGSVLGVTPELYQRLAEVTIPFSYESAVNPEFAPARVLRALGLEERAASDFIAARTRAAAEGSPAPTLPPRDGPSLFFAGRSSVYHIAVVAETVGGTAVELKAVYDAQIRGAGAVWGSTAAGQSPRRLSWREGR